jgi:hypothetical protein
MKKWILVCALSTLAMPLYAQVQFSITDFMRYGNGKQVSGTGDALPFEYFENQANIRLFWNDFTIGFRHHYDDPPEVGPPQYNVMKRYVEFQRSGLELRVGDYWTLYGKGLAMNLFENPGQNYDNGLDGLRAAYKNQYFKTQVAMGTLNFIDVDPRYYSRVEAYSVKSINAELLALDFVRIGGSYVRADCKLPTFFNPLLMNRVRAEIPELMLSLRGYGLEFFGEYAVKKSSVQELKPSGAVSLYDRTGEGLYASLAYASEKGFGITFEYKNYRFDVVDPINRAQYRPTRMLPIQNPPTVFKEHGFTLLSRNQHAIDFNDETGMQLDVYYAVSSKLTVNLNGSWASRQKAWSYSNTGQLVFETQKNFIPDLKADFAPFFELYGDVEWYFDGMSFIRTGFNRRYDVTNDGVARYVMTSTIPLRVEYMLNEEYSVTLQPEYQWVYDSEIKQSNYNNLFVNLALSKAPTWAVSVRMEYTTDKYDASGKDFWRLMEVAYRIASTHTVSLSYGSERGGLVCTNGICTVILPFDGVRFSLLSQI